MNCGYPISIFQGPKKANVPCGQCMNCRINKKRMWTGRILLENQYSALPGSFVTLTYNNDSLPDGHICPGGTLDPEDTRKWLMRLRKRLSVKLRYFLVGEYGSKSERAHYHAMIFGIPPETLEPLIKKTWPDETGYTKVGTITRASAQYVAHYTTKKLTDHDSVHLHGRYPEFARMSKSPPLGYPGALYLLGIYQSSQGIKALAEYKDVAATMRLDGKVYPISRYWRDWLRDRLGIPQESRAGNHEITLEEQEYATQKADKSWRQRHRRVTHSTI